MIVPHAGQSEYGFLFLTYGRYQRNRLLQIRNQGTHPGRKLTVQTNIDRVGNKSFRKFLRIPYVKD